MGQDVSLTWQKGHAQLPPWIKWWTDLYQWSSLANHPLKLRIWRKFRLKSKMKHREACKSNILVWAVSQILLDDLKASHMSCYFSEGWLKLPTQVVVDKGFFHLSPNRNHVMWPLILTVDTKEMCRADHCQWKEPQPLNAPNHSCILPERLQFGPKQFCCHDVNWCLLNWSSSHGVTDISMFECLFLLIDYCTYCLLHFVQLHSWCQQK